MEKINRHQFLQQTLVLSAGVALKPVGYAFFNKKGKTDPLFKRMVIANDARVLKFLQSPVTEIYSNRTAFEFAILSASFAAEASAYFQHPEIVTVLDKLSVVLTNAQSEDGTISMGNLESPPDTGFLLAPVCAAFHILSEHQIAELVPVLERMKVFILKAGNALKTGGIHTPNHRWVVSAALAQINQLFPDKSYVSRIDDWLGEGIYQDQDGHFPERSINYAVVENRSFLTIGRLLNRPALFEPVRKNLQMTYYYMDPDGSLVTTDSRRQDQYETRNIITWYSLYRYLAIKDQNKKFAAITRFIEGLDNFEENILSQSLYQFLDNPLLQEELPESEALPVVYEKMFSSSKLARIRNENKSITLFGGVDWPFIIASGRSNSPNFFAYRNGNAVLKYLRLSTDFFSTGYFYSNTLEKQNGAYILQQKREVPYYQPLPKEQRKPDGEYALTPSIDGRFWNKMAFDKRPVSNIKTLETKVLVTVNAGAAILEIEVAGMKGVEVTLELCFKEGGQLSGVVKKENSGEDFYLERGEGVYEYKGDRIRFGPGIAAVKKSEYLDGEMYSSHFGTLRTKGNHVYLTGITPFKHQLNFY